MNILNKIISKLLNFFLKKNIDKKVYMIGNSHILNMRKNYGNIQNLEELDYKIFSQNGEDGILDYLLFSIKIEKPRFIEIGVGDYYESNTRFIFERTSCEGLIIDILNNLKKKVEKNTKIWRGNLNILQKKIDTENFLPTLKEHNFLDNVDLFSLDIDSIDYWILEKLPNKFSKIIVAEYNPYFGSELNITVPNDENFNRTDYHYSNLCFGASLKSIVELLSKKGFIFLGTNLFRNNAFFINEDFKNDLSIKIPDSNNLIKFTKAYFRESRDLNNKLTLTSPEKILNRIEDCKVVDLSSKIKELKKISELIKKNN
jgi:hypothetical protein